LDIRVLPNDFKRLTNYPVVTKFGVDSMKGRLNRDHPKSALNFICLVILIVIPRGHSPYFSIPDCDAVKPITVKGRALRARF